MTTPKMRMTSIGTIATDNVYEVTGFELKDVNGTGYTGYCVYNTGSSSGITTDQSQVQTYILDNPTSPIYYGYTKQTSSGFYCWPMLGLPNLGSAPISNMGDGIGLINGSIMRCIGGVWTLPPAGSADQIWDGAVAPTTISVSARNLNGYYDGFKFLSIYTNSTAASNYIQLIGNVAGTPPVITTTGTTDTDIDISISGHGAGFIRFGSNLSLREGTTEYAQLRVNSSNTTLDAAGDIILDAGGADFNFYVGGAPIANLRNNVGNSFALSSESITLSATGGTISLDAVNSGITYLKTSGVTYGQISQEGASIVLSSIAGNNAYLMSPTVAAGINAGTSITLDADTNIVLDANDGHIYLKDNAVIFGDLYNSGGSLYIKSTGTTNITLDAESRIINATGSRIVSGTDPTGAQDFATKNYVDNVSSTIPSPDFLPFYGTAMGIAGDFLSFGRLSGSTTEEVTTFIFKAKQDYTKINYLYSWYATESTPRTFLLNICYAVALTTGFTLVGSPSTMVFPATGTYMATGSASYAFTGGVYYSVGVRRNSVGGQDARVYGVFLS